MDNAEEPVRLAGYPALAAGLGLLAVIGWASGLEVQQIVLQVAIAALMSIGGLEFARRFVTPLANPKQDDGTPLVPVDAERILREAHDDPSSPYPTSGSPYVSEAGGGGGSSSSIDPPQYGASGGGASGTP